MPTLITSVLWMGVAFVTYHIVGSFIADPLRRIPGPFITRLSSLWLAIQCRLGRRSAKVHELHRQYGDVVRITANHVSINRPDAVQEIYHRDKDFRKGPWYEPFNTPTPPILTIYDHAQHTHHRKILQPAFSPRTLREFEVEMNKNYVRWKEQLMKLGDEKIDLNTWVNFLAFDLISQFSFGKAFGFVERGEDFLNFILQMELRLTSATAIGVLPMWIRQYMPWFPFDDFWRASAESVIGIRKAVREAYDERIQGNGKGNENGKDLLSYLLQAKSGMSENQMLSHMAGFVIAGSDSTAASTIHLVDFVSRDAELQRKVQDEIDRVFPGIPNADWVPSYAETQNLRFVTAVAYEVLRLRPTAAIGLERYALEKKLTFAGHVLPAGTLVSVPTYSLHRNPEVFPDPDEFIPERWLAEDTTQQMKLFNLFSQGPRNCIGQTFAWMEMMKSVTILFKLWRVERAVEGETELFEGFFLKAKECEVVLKRRY